MEDKDRAAEEPKDNEPTPNSLTDLFETREERVGLRRGIYLLPNLITTGALFSGFYSIIASMSGDLDTAAIAIVVAGVLDAMDGRIARMTNTQTQFGLQYDSLSDLVAFGVAPAVMMFSWVLSDFGKLGWMIAFLYMACAALRLARFNTQPDNKVFTGLASPAAAGTMASIVWFWAVNFGQDAGVEVAIPAAVVTVSLALLMVSSVRYYSPKHLNLKGRVPFFYLLAATLIFALIATYPPNVLLAIGVLYVLSGPVQSVLRRRKSL